jgi:hypothetical protein
MPRGGSRSGAGRRRGSLNQKTREIAEEATDRGITALEVQLETMRRLWARAKLKYKIVSTPFTTQWEIKAREGHFYLMGANDTNNG